VSWSVFDLITDLTDDRSAGFTGAFIDREVETRGVRLPTFVFLQQPSNQTVQLDFFDKEKAKHAGMLSYHVI